MIDYVLAFMFISLFGSFTVVLMAFAWSLFEDTELGQMVIEKIRSWFEREEE